MRSQGSPPPPPDAMQDIDLSHFEHPRKTLVVLGYVMLALAVPGFVLVVANVSGAFPHTTEEARRAFALVVIGGVMCLVFGLSAALLITARAQLSIDDKQVTLRRSYLGLKRVKTLPNDGAGLLFVRRMEVATGNGHSVEVWPITYVHGDGMIELHRVRTAQEGRLLAERFAHHLGVSLVDGANGHAQLRPAGELDASVLDTVAIHDLRWPAKNPSSRLRMGSTGDGGVRIGIAPAGFGWSAVFGFALIAGAVLGTLRVIHSGRESESLGHYVWTAFILLLVGCFAMLGLRILWLAFSQREHWLATPGGLERVGRGSSSSARMTADEIESVAPSPSPGSVDVVSDEGLVRVGHDLSTRDANDLCTALLVGLAGRVPDLSLPLPLPPPQAQD